MFLPYLNQRETARFVKLFKVLLVKATFNPLLVSSETNEKETSTLGQNVTAHLLIHLVTIFLFFVYYVSGTMLFMNITVNTHSDDVCCQGIYDLLGGDINQ